VANVKNYGLIGVGAEVQLGKQGPKVLGDGDTDIVSVTTEDGVTLTQLRGAAASGSTDFVTKAQLDVVSANAASDGFALTMGNITSSGDGSWTDGSVQTITNATKVSESIDKLNEAMENIRNNTFVKSVDATTSVSSGGDPLTVTLTTSVVGTANRYTVVWGDGDTTTSTSDSTPSHTYTDNSNSPYDVVITAFNNSGSGEGSTASVTKTDFITLYTATPVANFDLYTASSGGSALTGDDREIDDGETIYLNNITTNSSTATCTYQINWGDGSSNTSVTSGGTGDVGQARASHTYSSDSGTGRFTITMQQTAHNTADPGEVGSTTTELLKVYDPTISAPSGLSSKTISFGESTQGSSPYLAHGYTDNSSEDSMTVGQSVSRITSSSAGSDTNSATLSSFSYNASAGNLHAVVNGDISGTIALSSGSDVGTNANLEITSESDYQSLTSAGSSASFSSSTFSPTLYKGFKARVSATSTDLATGSHSFKLSHDVTGNTNVVSFVKDDVTSTGVVDFSGATLAQSSAGTLAYESGVPYYTDDAVLTLTGVQLYNWIGQTYKNDSTPFDITNGTNSESTSGSTISTAGHNYAALDGSTTYLNSGIPKADTGKDSSNKYTIGTITVNVGAGGTGIEQLKARINNVNGNGSYAEHTAVKVQALNSSSGVNETIAVADALGAGFDDDGKRITGLASGDNPSFSSSTNYYTANEWSGAETIAGTQEAVTRFGTLSHFTTDLSSGILPVSPDLATGRSGAQYFTFAFRRTAMANFVVRLTGKVSGFFVAAPATGIDSASGLNGWVDAGITYGGAGTPGSDTGNGGNGSNGVAFTSGDRIVDGTTYSNDTFTLTLGDQNGTGSFGNNILVRIKLESGDSLTSLSIES
jgi:hypothetical protein|tara:strand:- start:11834 stop:14461 length:2628 start_codon:yes stop_codon:yes gene_type:complete